MLKLLKVPHNSLPMLIPHSTKTYIKLHLPNTIILRLGKILFKLAKTNSNSLGLI